MTQIEFLQVGAASKRCQVDVLELVQVKNELPQTGARSKRCQVKTLKLVFAEPELL